MATPLRATTNVPSRAFLGAQRGAFDDRYTRPLDRPVNYVWTPGSAVSIDGVTALGHTGGTNGRWIEQRLTDKGANLADADATLQVGGDRWRVLPTATLSANRIITLGTTSAANGDTITITRLDATAFTLAIVNGGVGAGTLCTLPASQRWYVTFYFDGTNWTLRSGGQLPA